MILPALLLPLACRALPAQDAAPRDPLPPAREGITILAGEDGETKLDELLDDFSRVTGVHLLIGPETQVLLRRSSTSLNRTLEVLAEDVPFVVETILMSNGVLLVRHGDGDPWILGVVSRTEGSHSGALRNLATLVPEEELPLWRRHPAFLVSTVVDLPTVDVRQLSNSIRTMFTDANTQQIVPTGMANALIVTDFAPRVADIVTILRRVEETVGGTPAEEPDEK